ncbi:MAG: FliG C-terminal domain-containing protein [Planctomycetota bacterium]
MNNDSQSINRQSRLRKAAILVSTLGEPLAEQLLAELPEHDATEVRLLVDALDGVEQHELESLLADFQDPSIGAPDPIAIDQASSLSGVELDASLLAKLDAQEDYTPPTSSERPNEHWKAISDADAETLVEILSDEQPQTIAVVLAHIEPAQAAELLSRLPAEIQTKTLTRLSDLDPADEQSLQVVRSQLADWIEARQQRRRRISAGRALVDKILQHTPDAQRIVLQSKLGSQHFALESSATTSTPTAATRSTGISTSRQKVLQPASRQNTHQVMSAANECTDALTNLESLDDHALLKALQSVDRKTVMLALAGASESLMKRIVSGLPRRQANQFRQQVRGIGPTRLSDMVAAQQELVRCGQA